jgi:hypothetical protein
MCATAAVIVEPIWPKFNPVSVVEAPPEMTVFCMEKLTSGASKLYRTKLVPATAETVTCQPMSSPTPYAVMHWTDVSAVHAALLHASEPSCTVAVGPSITKFKPETVTEAPIVAGKLYALAYDTTGASNVSKVI